MTAGRLWWQPKHGGQDVPRRKVLLNLDPTSEAGSAPLLIPVSQQIQNLQGPHSPSTAAGPGRDSVSSVTTSLSQIGLWLDRAICQRLHSAFLFTWKHESVYLNVLHFSSLGVGPVWRSRAKEIHTEKKKTNTKTKKVCSIGVPSFTCHREEESLNLGYKLLQLHKMLPALPFLTATSRGSVQIKYLSSCCEWVGAGQSGWGRCTPRWADCAVDEGAPGTSFLQLSFWWDPSATLDGEDSANTGWAVAC